MNNALQRAAAGGMLTMRELLEIAEVLRVIRSLSECAPAAKGWKPASTILSRSYAK